MHIDSFWGAKEADNPTGLSASFCSGIYGEKSGFPLYRMENLEYNISAKEFTRNEGNPP